MKKYLVKGIIVALLMIVLAACSGGSSEPEVSPEVSTAESSVKTIPVTATAPGSAEDTPAAVESVQGTAYPQPGQIMSVQPAPSGAYPAPQVGQVAPTMPPYPAPTEQRSPAYPTETIVVAPTKTVKTELHATDPSTVTLASGDVQLVEFFAFW